jgi:hypothetical protein
MVRFEETVSSPSHGGDGEKMGARVWSRLRPAFGIALLVVGAIGVVVPIIPGVPLLMAGASVLGPDHPVVRVCTGWMRSGSAALSARLTWGLAGRPRDSRPA